MIYFCSQRRRRALVLQDQDLNGIDYLEVPGAAGCGTALVITFLRNPNALGLTPENIVVSGDTAVQVMSVGPASDGNPLVSVVQLDHTGDFSRYTLEIVAKPGVTDPPDGLDPQLSTVMFSFKAGCPTPVDCLPATCCPPPAQVSPDINYLAKDYPAFVQVMLDRLAVCTPGWTETHAADLGIAMVETLAYAADHLSYQQDAVNTEAYIGTARSRISLRRHARLVDYAIGEGCNARAWIHLEAATNDVALPRHTPFYVNTPGLPSAVDPQNTPLVQTLENSTQPIFASLCDAVLQPQLNCMRFHTWGDEDCCLPTGATQATLCGHLDQLAEGAVLIFEERLGPLTGDTDDADPMHRWPVRVTSVVTRDWLDRDLFDPLHKTPITRIAWCANDALPFPLCLSSTIKGGPNDGKPVIDVSVALGNIVPADHGSPVSCEHLGIVPPAPPQPVSATSCDCDAQGPSSATALAPHARFYPQLARAPLTFTRPYDAKEPASALALANPSGAQPTLCVKSDDGTKWMVSADLLTSEPEDPHFVAEVEFDGTVFLRFGDGQYGRAADSGLCFTADYRIGNGSIGNVGHDAIAHVIASNGSIKSVRNPLPAGGGVDPEDMSHIRQYAPFAFQTQERCVTEADYGAMAQRDARVRQARGTLRWTGSWHTAFVSVEPLDTEVALQPALVACTTQRLNLARMMGTDLAVEPAAVVGLSITLAICVAQDHFQGDVRAALLRVFITGDQCTGAAGLLNAANFTFGETVYASPLVAAAQAVDGVVSATLTEFSRMDNPSGDGVAEGCLVLGRLEIPRCDNDPDHLDHGRFTLQLDGGK